MRLRTGIMLGCAALAIVGTATSVLVGACFLHMIADPEGLWLSAEAADVVELGEEFRLVVTARNRLSDREIELGDLDISHDYLDGFTVVSMEPAPKSSEIDDFNKCRTTRFAVSLGPGESADFEFTLRAKRVGIHRGQIDQYVGMQFLSSVVETEVRR
jgi:hypothetical protein